MEINKTYKIIGLNLQGGPKKVDRNTSSSIDWQAEAKWFNAVREAEEIAIKEFEDLLNKHCNEDNDWRLDSVHSIPYTWGGNVSYKTIVVLKNMGDF